MLATKRNAPHKRRTKVLTNKKIIARKPIFIDVDENEFTPLGSAVMLIMLAIIVSQGAIVYAPLHWLGWC